MKYIRITLISLFVLGALFLAFKKHKPAVTPVVISTTGQYCFKKVFNKDVTDVKLQLQNGKVTGTMDWIPYEKDSGRGTLAGTIAADGEMSLIFDYMIEGSHQTETKLMKIENGKLLVKHGELVDPKYDGHLIYKDVTQAVYNETLDPCVVSL